MDGRGGLSGDAILEDLQQNYLPGLENRYPSLEVSGGAAKEEADQVAEGLKQNTS
ncbi:MAG: hypothetical protein ACRER2_10275 [Methylococcales bacterium]